MPTAYIALGANLGQPAQQLSEALRQLAQVPGIQLDQCSPFYRTAPLGPAGQPDYCNAVCAVDATLPPETLLQQLLKLELCAGRSRNGERWGPRLLDLDLLHVEGASRCSATLTLPHPEIAHRNFVLVPWADIAPELEIPGVGRVGLLARRIGRNGLAPWHD